MDRRHLELIPAKLPGAELDDSDLLRVGDLARSTGKTVRAIHHYEELGLIEPAKRSKGHYRLFAPEAHARVQWITKLQSLGLSLTEIRQTVTERRTSPSARQAAHELKALYEDKLAEVRSRLVELRELEQELEASLAYLQLCTASCEDDAPPDACGTCKRHDDKDSAPLLVIGARGH